MLISFDYLFSKYEIKTSGCVHLGANTGQELQAYIANGVKRVIWVEALPALHQQLSRNIARIPGHLALCACLSDTDGQEVTFHIASNGGQSSSFLEFGTHAIEHPTVRYTSEVKMKLIRVETLFNDNQIELSGKDWFLNADLQGAELLALKGMGKLLHHFKYAYIETNTKELYKGCAMFNEVAEYLAGFGFHHMESKMTGSGWGDSFFMRK